MDNSSAIFNGWQTWLDILTVAVVLYFLILLYKKYKKNKKEKDRIKNMTEIEFNAWVEEENAAIERAAKEKIKDMLTQVEKLNNAPNNKNVFNSVCMQHGGRLIVYNKFYYEEDIKKVALSYNTYYTPEGYHSFTAYDSISHDKMQKDRERFLKFKEELAHFGLEIKRIESTSES